VGSLTVRHPHGQAVTIVRSTPGGFDAYGDPIPGTETRTVVAGCAVAPRLSTEPTERGRQGVVVGFTVYLPPRSGVTYPDQLEIGGVLYSIVGEPGQWVNPFDGSTPGDEVAVVRAAG
jgi:hypothetical protein